VEFKEFSIGKLLMTILLLPPKKIKYLYALNISIAISIYNLLLPESAISHLLCDLS
jgi:hypothetical protein